MARVDAHSHTVLFCMSTHMSDGRVCTEQDTTATDPEELLISDSMSTDEAVDSMLHHGISIFPNLLQENTSQALRDTIIEFNTIEENFFVLGKKARYSYGIRVEQHPAVRQAIHEIVTHPVLQPALRQVLGDEPSIYKFHAITSTAGAPEQNFHWDVIPQKSAAMYARSFMPIYSLFLPLQNTTRAMGSTDICPGTHICTGGTKFCQRTAFRASGRADNWPAGYGALMNQQMTHRGRKHVDETPGSERVLFILAFTPRPRVGNHVQELETRGLSLGGSYATHWSQWGFTTADLADNWRRMQNPWKILRSLGLYKTTAAAKWGWDYVTMVLIRIANGDFLNIKKLQKAIREGAFSYIPEFLRPELREDESDGFAWYYFASDAVVNAKQFLEKLCKIVAGVYVLGSIGLMALGGRKLSKRTVASNSVRMLLIPAAVYALYMGLNYRIASSPWARHIKTGKLYQLSTNYRGPRLPAVLPTESDVLITDDYQSDYLASYTRLLDIAHPGNKAWNDMLANYARGYDRTLSESLKTQLSDSLVQWNIHQNQGRILTKNHENQWAQLTDPMARDFVHKQLMRDDNKFVDAALRQLDYLVSETKFGTWRDTALHMTHIPTLLRSLERKILKWPASAVVAMPKPDVRGLVVRPQPAVSSSPAPTAREFLVGTRRNAIPPPPAIEEPFPGAWLKVGDEVEGRYKSQHNEWYRGTIMRARGHQATWDVLYHDGDKDFRLCRQCVRPFAEYQVGEVVDHAHEANTDDWRTARILAVHGDNTYDIEHLTDDRIIVRGLQTKTGIRRFKTEEEYASDGPFWLGEQVEARWYDEEGEDPDEHDGKWYLGTIVNVNGDDTYGVEYDDGDYESQLPGSEIQSLS